jgi:hypothetical protein
MKIKKQFLMLSGLYGAPGTFLLVFGLVAKNFPVIGSCATTQKAARMCASLAAAAERAKRAALERAGEETRQACISGEAGGGGSSGVENALGGAGAAGILKAIADSMPAAVGASQAILFAAEEAVKTGYDPKDSIAQVQDDGAMGRKLASILGTRMGHELKMQDLSSMVPRAVKLCAREAMKPDWITKQFREQFKAGPGAPNSFMLISAIEIVDKMMERLGRMPQEVLGAEANQTWHWAGDEQLAAGPRWIAVIERIIAVLRDEKVSKAMPNVSQAEQGVQRAAKSQMLINRVVMGSMEHKHQAMVDEWTRETEHGKRPPSPTRGSMRRHALRRQGTSKEQSLTKRDHAQA